MAAEIPPVSPAVFRPSSAIMLHRHKEYEQSKLHLMQFRDLFDSQDEEVKSADPEVIEQAKGLGRLLGV